MTPETLYLRWLLLVNGLALVLFGVDKRLAVGGWRRIPEALLIWVLLLGGVLGGVLGRLLFRHKTRKLRFTVALVAGALLHGGLLWVWWRGAGLP